MTLNPTQHVYFAKEHHRGNQYQPEHTRYVIRYVGSDTYIGLAYDADNILIARSEGRNDSEASRNLASELRTVFSLRIEPQAA